MDTALIAQNLQTTLESVLPRILTQACRDPGNPAYGCFDRNWWHYRIRDFASIILQQGGYAVLRAAEVCSSELISGDFAKSIAAGSCRFWNTRACRHGSFEEYYPWEQGYPPVAFSTLAVAKLVAEGVIPEAEVHKGLTLAANQLASRFEPKAANQQIAGLAALAWVKKTSPSLVSDADFSKQKNKSLSLQTDEGWFWEYDGPDIGYLSVTLDCLWDLFDATGDDDFRKSADKAMEFIYDVIALPNCGLGMLNARNTDYVVPYGISRYIADGTQEQRGKAASILEILYAGTDSPTHFFKAIDDRYWCHYIGHSVARAVAILRNCDEVVTPPQSQSDMAFPTSGYVFTYLPGGEVVTLALNKGGCVRLTQNDRSAHDFGWIVDTGKKQYVSHWWSLDWTVSSSPLVHTEHGVSPSEATPYALRPTPCGVPAAKGHGVSPSETTPYSLGPTPSLQEPCPMPMQEPGSWTISGNLVAHKEATSSPFMHLALRLMSLVFGKSIIVLLKNVMIFKKAQGPYSFIRAIKKTSDGLVIEDTIHGLTGAEKISPASRASKRHVASADSFSTEDFDLLGGFNLGRSVNRTKEKFEAVTLISPATGDVAR